MTKQGSCASEATGKQVPRVLLRSATTTVKSPKLLILRLKPPIDPTVRSVVQSGLHPSTVTSRLITMIDDSRLSLTLSPVAGLLATSPGQPAAPPLGGSGGLQHGRQVHRSLLLP